jgi:hypothetical protein
MQRQQMAPISNIARVCFAGANLSMRLEASFSFLSSMAISPMFER